MANIFRTRELPKVDRSSLEFVGLLGRGGFGLVSLMIDFNSNSLYAEKSTSFNHLLNIEKEIRIMRRFRNHPRIVQLASNNFHLDINPERCNMYMEFASRGTLHDMIFNLRKKPMSEKIIGRATLMILQGLEALHSNDYVHCDLKPANVLVFPSKAVGEPWDLKLADFGLSKEPSTDPSTLFHGTNEYMPLEAFGPNRVIGPAVDIWSLGCMVIEMFGGHPERMGYFYIWRLPKLVSSMANDFLRRCLEWKPSLRATHAELLNHPFVKQKVIKVKPPQDIYFPCPSSLGFSSDTEFDVIPECCRR